MTISTERSLVSVAAPHLAPHYPLTASQQCQKPLSRASQLPAFTRDRGGEDKPSTESDCVCRVQACDEQTAVAPATEGSGSRPAGKGTHIGRRSRLSRYMPLQLLYTRLAASLHGHPPPRRHYCTATFPKHNPIYSGADIVSGPACGTLAVESSHDKAQNSAKVVVSPAPRACRRAGSTVQQSQRSMLDIHAVNVRAAVV